LNSSRNKSKSASLRRANPHQTILSNTNGQKLQQVTQIQQQVQTIFDPEVVRKYAELVPDAPERILAVFEKMPRPNVIYDKPNLMQIKKSINSSIAIIDEETGWLLSSSSQRLEQALYLHL